MAGEEKRDKKYQTNSGVGNTPGNVYGTLSRVQGLGFMVLRPWLKESELLTCILGMAMNMA